MKACKAKIRTIYPRGKQKLIVNDQINGRGSMNLGKDMRQYRQIGASNTDALGSRLEALLTH